MPRRRHSAAGELNRALDAALAHGDLALALAAAADLSAVDLGRAAKLLHLMARDRSPLFDRAAARWLSRFSADVRGEQLAALETEHHALLTTPKVARLLERAEAWLD